MPGPSFLFHQRPFHKAGVDLRNGKATGRRESAFAGESGSGRWNLGYSGAVPSQANRIGEVTTWVPEAPDLGDDGYLSEGPHEGVKEQPTTETSVAHTIPMPSSGFFDLLMNGSPDLVEGRNEGKFEVKEVAWSMENTRSGGIQKTSAMGSSGKTTDGEYDPLSGMVPSGSKGGRPVPCGLGRGLVGLILPPLRADLDTAALPDLARSDSDVNCLPGIVMPKSWVLNPVFQPIPSPAMGFLVLISTVSPVGPIVLGLEISEEKNYFELLLVPGWAFAAGMSRSTGKYDLWVLYKKKYDLWLL